LELLLGRRTIRVLCRAPANTVRVTLRDTTGGHSLVGRLTLVAADSLVLRVADTDSIISIDRRTVLRVERHSDVSVRKTMLAGCVAIGGILALAGSQVHDPDSQGIERIVSAAGAAFGCLLGALGGFAISSLRERNSWEEITLAAIQ
jgi:hypothetical protein